MLGSRISTDRETVEQLRHLAAKAWPGDTEAILGRLGRRKLEDLSPQEAESVIRQLQAAIREEWVEGYTCLERLMA